MFRKKESKEFYYIYPVNISSKQSVIRKQIKYLQKQIIHLEKQVKVENSKQPTGGMFFIIQVYEINIVLSHSKVTTNWLYYNYFLFCSALKIIQQTEGINV